MELRGAFSSILLLLSGLLLLFVLAPLLGLYLSTGPDQYLEAIGDRNVVRSIGLTLWTSMLATLIFSFLGIPLAYILARKNFPLKSLVTGLIDLPVVIPHTAAGIALLGVISRNTVAGKAASAIGLDFVGNPAGIIIAMAFVSLPFLVQAAKNGFEAVPVKYEQVARNLGASPVRVFFTISLPLALRSIISGMILMFARGMSEFGAVVIIAYHPMIAPVLIYERFGSYGLDYARPVAALFILVSLFFFVVLRVISTRKKDA
jgi:molybdate/tungstate transport system permease protein